MLFFNLRCKFLLSSLSLFFLSDSNSLFVFQLLLVGEVESLGSNFANFGAIFCSCQLELQTTAEFVVAFLLQRCGGDDWNLSGRANQNAGEVLHHTNRGSETSRGDHVGSNAKIIS